MASFLELKHAVETENVNLICRLIRDGLDINVRDSWGRTALHYAVEMGKTKMVKLLLRFGVNVNSRDINGYTPLHCVCTEKASINIQNRLFKDTTIQKQLMRKMMSNPSECPVFMLDILTDPIIEIFESLLSYGAEINAIATSQATSMTRALQSGKLKAVRVLAQLGIPIGPFVWDGLTPFLLCAKETTLTGVMKYLHKVGASVNSKVTIRSPLHLAIDTGRIDFIDILLHHGADLSPPKLIQGTFSFVNNTLNQKHEKYAQNLQRLQHNKAKQCLVDLGTDLNESDVALPVVHQALLNKNCELISYLVQSGADLKDLMERIPKLQQALRLGDQDLVEFLLKNGAMVETDGLQIDPLQHAVSLNDIEAMKVLLELGAEVNSFVCTGSSTLLEALISNGPVESMVTMHSKVCKKASRNVVKTFSTALQTAIEKDSYESVKLLLQSGAEMHEQVQVPIFYYFLLTLNSGNPHHLLNLSSITYKGKDEFSSLFQDVGQAIDRFLECGVDINSPKITTPLVHSALKCRDSRILDLLLDHGAGVSDCQVIMPPIFLAACQNDQRSVEALMKNKTNSSVHQRLITPISAAVQLGNEELVSMLVQRGASIGLNLHYDKVYENHSILHAAIILCQSNNYHSVDLPEKQFLSQDVTANVLASKGISIEMIKILLKYGLDVNETISRFITPVHTAVLNGNNEILKLLIEKPQFIEASMMERFSPLHCALKIPSIDLAVVKVLVEAGADVNAGYDEYVTPVHLAVRGSNISAIKLLFEGGLDMNAGKSVCVRPVHLATYNRREDILEYLVSEGADLELATTENVSPLHDAVEMRNTEMMKTLTEFGGSVYARKKSGVTPIFAATIGEEVPQIRTLVNLGANVNAVVRKRVSVLHDGLESPDEEIRELCKKYDLIEPLPMIVTPLEICIVNNFLEKAHFLLSIGAQKCSPLVPYQEELDDKMTLEMLKCLGLCEEQSKLMSKTGNMYMTTRKNRSLLKTACKVGHMDMIRLLLISRCLTEFDSKIPPFNILPFSEVVDYHVLKEASKSSQVVQAIKLNKDTHHKLLVRCKDIGSIGQLPGFGDVKCIPGSKAMKIMEAAEEFIIKILGRLVKFSGGAVKRIGSSAEGAKVGLPDEMDFLLQFELAESEIAEVRDAGFGYAHYSNALYELVSDGSRSFHLSFLKELKKAINLQDLGGVSRQISLNVADTPFLDDDNRKACSVLTLDWKEEQFILPLSVDVVPSFHINGWPKDGVTETWLMNSEQLKRRGYLLVPKSPHVKSQLAKRFKEDDLKTMWRLSFAHLETEHMQCLEKPIRDVYVTAKCLRNPEVCRILITDAGSYHKPVDKYISSYMLKMMFLKNVKKFRRSSMSIGDMICKVYDDLEEGLSRGFVPLFFMPQMNALDGIKVEIEKSAKVAKIMKIFVHKLNDCRTVPCAQGAPTGTSQPVYQSFDICR